MEPLLVDVETLPNGTVVHIGGEIRIDCSALELQLRKVVAQHPMLVVLDLGRLTFISSLGMGCIVGLRKGIAQRGGKVRLAAALPMVKDALTRARLLDVMEHFDSVEAALAAPASPQAPAS